MAQALIDNLSLPFQVAEADVRGRIVRLGSVADDIIVAHDYPAPVARLLGDALALVSLLATALKFEGIFTLQAQSQGREGPLSLLCADYRTGEGVRGYANLDTDLYENLVRDLDREPTLSDLMPKGYLAFTIDRGGEDQRYQGIVGLQAEGLAASAEAYFRESEQIPSLIRLATAEHFHDGVREWRCGGLLVQKMPDEGVPDFNEDKDLWPRIGHLTATVKDHELIDPMLGAPDLLFRLYHEDGIRVFDPIAISRTCRCSEAKISATLAGFKEDELAEMLEDGVIAATCAFCSTTYRIDPKSLKGKGWRA
ncbi:MAG: Hsp33 family molecular chaperone HslO [Alphaproteobacteria bacterium]